MQLKTLEIADIAFYLASDETLHIEESDPSYLPFIPEDNGFQHQTAFPVNIKLEAFPDTRHMEKVFDSGDAYTILRNSSDIISYHLPGSAKPYWMAQIQPNNREAIVYCSREMFHRSSNGVLLQNPLHYPLDQLLMMYFLSGKRGGILHAAGININGCGYAFAGRSGAGKSTLMKLFSAQNGFQPLSDDRLVIRHTTHGLTLYGTPWPGDGGWCENIGIPLKALFFLKKSGHPKISPLSPQKTSEYLLPVMTIPWYDAEMLNAYMNFCEYLASQVQAFEISFSPDREIGEEFRRLAASL